MEIKKFFNKREEENHNNIDYTINLLNKEFEINNLDIVDDIENKIKIFFKDYKNLYIELSKVDIYQEIKNHFNFINNINISNTKKNPNFINNNIIIENTLSLFEIYYPFGYQDEIFLVYQNVNLTLEIKSITQNKFITSLNDISNKVTIIKHFFNLKNSFDYLCVSDTKKLIYVYNLSLNYIFLYQIKTDYSFNIFSCLLFFDNKNNNNYLITSTYAINENNYTKAYLLEDGTFIKNYIGTNHNHSCYLLFWFHKILKCNYIIELCSEKLFIYQMITSGLYMEVNFKDIDFMKGCILEDKDKKEFLYCSTSDNMIYVFDLYKKTLAQKIELWKEKRIPNDIYDMIKWSNKFLIICNYKNNCINVIDINQNKIITCIKGINNGKFLFLKKIIHPLYGDSLLASTGNSTVNILV